MDSSRGQDLHSQSSRSVSIASSDSTSYLTSISQSSTEHQHHQPSNRPDVYPPSILWTLEDAQNDPMCGATGSNKSRPAMERAIRFADGRTISTGEWRGILASAREVFQNH